jgi:dUTPase
VFPRFANADDCHHASGVAVRSAMGEEEIGVALRAAAYDLNGFGAEAGGEKLAAIGFDEIDVKAGPNWRVAGRALSEKKHGVFLAHGVSVVDLAKELARV